ncbi:receptor-like protein EIX1 [Corylus avellana]|uniref:receptor-like protein EIX1 n=1 Tax=Corylus avellana TaxID=13451 RepID=UPI00286B91B0|nr:receptor-like protein EIX1 [Corylus avellana]
MPPTQLRFLQRSIAGACRAATPQRRDGASQPVVLQMEHVQWPKPDKRDQNLAGDLVPEEVDDFEAVEAGKSPGFEIEKAREVLAVTTTQEMLSSLTSKTHFLRLIIIMLIQIYLFRMKRWKLTTSRALGGKISSSLLDLKYLSYLDLSLNNFDGINIPKFLGSLESLTYLNLSFSLFAGVIPPHLWNLSRLQYLDLHSFSFSINFYNFSSQRLEVESLEWVNAFPSLKYLGMNFVNLEKVPNWFHAVNMLPSLQELHLVGCGLVSLPHSVSSINFTLLSALDLSYNHFNSFIPHWLSNVSGLSTIKLKSTLLRGTLPVGLGHLTNLRVLNLAGNNLIGRIPNSFANLCNLQALYMYSNNINGEITEFVNGLSQCSNSSSEDGNLSSLQALALSYNQLNGTIPKSIGKLSMLVSLDLTENSWEGVLTKAHFQNLTRLKSLRLSTNLNAKGTLVLDVTHEWVPPFQLESIFLSKVQIGPNFPAWLKIQNKLNFLVLDNAGISDTIPHGLWKSCPNVTYWSLSNNKLRGKVPYFQFHPLASYFDLCYNNLEGPVPLFHSNLRVINLGNNMFSGPIPKNISELLPKLSWLDLSSNSITGRIPYAIGMLKELNGLILGNNSLSGKLPHSMRHLSSLNVLSLPQNYLEGELPSFFRNYRNLKSLDLGGNKFSGKLPAWMGESSPYLLRCNPSMFRKLEK